MYVSLRAAQRLTRTAALNYLGLPTDSRHFEAKVIKKAYREKAKIFHPDSPTGNVEDFKKLQEALEVIEKGGIEGKFDFEFDEGDGNSFWTEMKQSMEHSQGTYDSFSVTTYDSLTMSHC